MGEEFWLLTEARRECCSDKNKLITRAVSIITLNSFWSWERANTLLFYKGRKRCGWATSQEAWVLPWGLLRGANEWTECAMSTCQWRMCYRWLPLALGIYFSEDIHQWILPTAIISVVIGWFSISHSDLNLFVKAILFSKNKNKVTWLLFLAIVWVG